MLNEYETPKFLEYNSFIHFKSYRIVARCALCGREIIDPTKCIVYESFYLIGLRVLIFIKN